MTRPHHRFRILGTLVIAALIAVGLVVLPSQSASAAVLLTEPFTAAAVANSGWQRTGTTACLTKATTATTPLGVCAGRADAPSQTLADGFLQLNDNESGVSGGVIYTNAIQAANGLDVTFDQYQQGPVDLLADGEGIGFFLSDGAATLSTNGAAGGSLGYAQLTGTNGVNGGYLGIGLDVAGNYSTASGGRGSGCAGSTAGTTPLANQVVARGPGQGTSGYCYLGRATAPGTLRTSTGLLISGVLGSADPPASYGRTIRITVGTGSNPTVNVYYGSSAGLTLNPSTTTPLLTVSMGAPALSSYHLGFTGVTSGSGLTSVRDTHLIRNLKVSALNSLTVAAAVANPQPSYAQGATVPYQYTVTNTGALSVSTVAVTDSLGTAISCPVTTLAAGAATTCTGNHVVTATEATAATTLGNTATATATATTGALSASSSVSVAITTPVRTLTLSKVGALIENAPANAKADAGEKIAYTFTATNTGNVTATNVVVSDPRVSGISPASATLLPGASQVFTAAQYTVTAADIDAGSPITNTASVSANGFAPVSSTANTPINYAPAIAITANGTLSGAVTPGSTIGYSFTVTNTGTTTLTSVAIADPLAPATITWPSGSTVGTLASGQTVTATASRTVTQSDIDAGQVVNVATASATAPNGTIVTASATTTTPLTRTPGLSFTKTANVNLVKAAGDVITYTFTATNAGNTTLSGVSIADPLVGLSALVYTWPGPVGSLAPTKTLTATASYTTTAADVTAGSVPNTATITATPAGATAITRTASVAVPVVPDPQADYATVPQGDSVVINVLANDAVAANGALFSRAQLSSTPTAIGGAATPAPATPVYGSVTCEATGTDRGTCSYRSVDYFVGTDTFDYAISGTYGTWNVRVTVTVTAKNRAPVARADRLLATTGGSAMSVDPLANDTDTDAGDTLALQSIAVPGGSHGTFACSATCSYQPANDGWTGSISIPYVVRDAAGLTASSTITVFVDPAPLTLQGFTDTKANATTAGIGTWTSTTTTTSPAGTCVANRPSTTVSWAAAAGATSYVLERQLAGSGTWVRVAVLGPVTSFTDDRLGEGRSYQWRVRPDLQRWPGITSPSSSASSQVAVTTAKGC